MRYKLFCILSFYSYLLEKTCFVRSFESFYSPVLKENNIILLDFLNSWNDKLTQTLKQFFFLSLILLLHSKRKGTERGSKQGAHVIRHRHHIGDDRHQT